MTNNQLMLLICTTIAMFFAALILGSLSFSIAGISHIFICIILIFIFPSWQKEIIISCSSIDLIISAFTNASIKIINLKDRNLWKRCKSIYKPCLIKSHLK